MIVFGSRPALPHFVGRPIDELPAAHECREQLRPRQNHVQANDRATGHPEQRDLRDAQLRREAYSLRPRTQATAKPAGAEVQPPGCQEASWPLLATPRC